MSSEPSPFTSLEEQEKQRDEAIRLEQQQLLSSQEENERAFEELNQQRLRELENAENEEIRRETKEKHVVKDKTIQEFLGGFSETILGIINDTLYKLANPGELSWGDILTENNRPMYLGLLIVIISVFIAITK